MQKNLSEKLLNSFSNVPHTTFIMKAFNAILNLIPIHKKRPLISL